MSQVKKIQVHESKPITAGAILTYNIPPYSTVDDILLTIKGSAATDANIRAGIGKIALNVNGEQIINTPLSTILDYYTYMGVEVNQNRPANVIGIMVGNRIWKNPLMEKLFAIGCNNVQTIQLQVYCNSSVTGLSDLEVSTVRRNFESDTQSLIKIIDYPQNVSGAGISSVDQLPRDSGDAVLCVLAYPGTGGVISAGEMIVNGESVIDPITIATAGYIGTARGHQPISGVFPYDVADGSETGLLPLAGVQELRIKTNFSTAPTSGVYDLVAMYIKNTPAMLNNAVLA